MCFLILWIIRVEFQPLDQIAQHLSHKKQHLSDAATYLLELKTQNIPKEIQPFVDGLLQLIHDLHQSLENEKVLVPLLPMSYAVHSPQLKPMYSLANSC